MEAWQGSGERAGAPGWRRMVMNTLTVAERGFTPSSVATTCICHHTQHHTMVRRKDCWLLHAEGPHINYQRSCPLGQFCFAFCVHTVCYFTGIFYAVVRQIIILFIDNKDSVFCIHSLLAFLSHPLWHRQQPWSTLKKLTPVNADMTQCRQ